mgnify:FL=1
MLKNQYNFNNQTGQFKERIEIFMTTISSDQIGQNVKVNTSIGRYWAMVKTYVNRNEIRNGLERTAEDLRFVVKYSKGLNDLLNSSGTIFDVSYDGLNYRVLEAINDNQQNKTFTLRVEALK